MPAVRAPRRPKISRRTLAVASGAAVLVTAVAAGLWLQRPAPVASPHGMSVRLAGFRLLSPDLPANTPAIVDTEIEAAFNADGVVGVSTAAAAAPGSAPAYALGGTIQRVGESIRVITRLTNERSGETLWTNTFNYDGAEAARVPRHIAVDSGNVVRCGLFGASTYGKPLPDSVLRDYMQFCQGHWDPHMSEGRKALLPAQRVTAAVPDFSWGWAAVAGAYWKVAASADDERFAEEARAKGREAADRAIAIDDQNSEALYIKAMMVPKRDWLARESLLRRAVAARRLDCGCEHHQYGWLLMHLGRISEAVEELRLANDMLSLYVYTPLTLSDALAASGKPDEARQYFQASIDLAPDSDFAGYMTATLASQFGDIDALAKPDLPMPEKRREALLAGFRALASGNPIAMGEAAQALVRLPPNQQNDSVALLLGKLGADHAAFQVAARLAESEYPGPSIFWYPSMRGALDDPAFPALAEHLGLVNYWKTSRTRPDVCKAPSAPGFCKLL
jgi:tetratricopeptide (TPR) repeat protein